MGRARSFQTQDILERATLLFWRNGYNGTSMRELVDATGLAKASLYNAFGNKEDIFLAVLNYYIEQKQCISTKPLREIANGRDALDAYFANLAHNTLENKKTPGCLLVNTAAEQAIHEPAMRELVDKGMSRTEGYLAKTVARGIKDGSISPNVDPYLAGACLVNVVVGIRVMACKGISEKKLHQVIEANLKAHTPKPSKTAARQQHDRHIAYFL